MMFSRACCVAALLAALGSSAHADDTRFIPIELWTGAPWSGEPELTLTPADLTFGNGRKHIEGPLEWKDPVTGARTDAYRRVHFRQNKTQIFAITHDGLALGRIYDSRYKVSIRGGAKFPLGTWHQDEHRTFDAVFTTEAGNSFPRRMTITILDIDFKHAGNTHCLRFRWTLATPGESRLRDDNNYTYCPGMGLVNLTENDTG